MAAPRDDAAHVDSIDFANGSRSPDLDSSDSDNDSLGVPSPAGSASSDPTNILRLPALKSTDQSFITPSSTHLGLVQNARRPNPPPMAGVRGMQQNKGVGGGLPIDMAEKMKAFHLSRQGTPKARPQIGASASVGAGPVSSPQFASSPGGSGGMKLNLPGMRPAPHNFVSAPAVPKSGGLAARRAAQLGGAGGGMKLPTALPDSNSASSNGNGESSNGFQSGNAFSQYSKYVDTKTGTLNFDGKAVIHGQGIDFASGNNFSISLDEVDTMEELGKGNYGTVYKVRHARPRGIRRPGLGLAGSKMGASSSSITTTGDFGSAESSPKTGGNTTGVVMAMKEIRLELDEAKFAAIIMELDILHRCLSPYIIDFYGAFFQEGAVYICIEFMDGGSLDNIYGDGVPENILRKITYCTTQGLKTLKDDHNIIHRDVKPTNILVNTRGQVKICDFGVSGNLVASIARTNIGCQSYMAPERISGGGMAQAGSGGGTYSVQSDIWSLGLSIIECAMGRYPYPPETYNNIFSQLNVSRIPSFIVSY
jgi:mitogen-activated protein kinase kinase